MENFTVKTDESRINSGQFDRFQTNCAEFQGLDFVFDRETVRREISNNETDFAEFESGKQRHRLDLRQTFSYFGSMLVFFPLVALLTKLHIDKNLETSESYWTSFYLLVIALTSMTGYLTGGPTAKIVRIMEKQRWLTMIILSPLTAVVWILGLTITGLLTGGISGIFVSAVSEGLSIGGIIGFLISILLGVLSFPIFLIFHRLLKKGERLETKYFLPAAFGIVLTICALIFGIR